MDELKYRLMLVQATEDDPLENAHMLMELKKKYDELDVKMSDKMKAYIKDRVVDISKKLSDTLSEKKKKYNELIQQVTGENNKESNEDKIFSEEDIKKFLEKKKK
ncbi:MAG: hypothetical protein ACQEP1_06415 [Nanobdellota archaeon]